MQRGPLPGQQPCSHRLAEQRVPGLVLSIGGVLAKQPGRGQLPQPVPDGLGVQPANRAQQVLSQGAACHRKPRQHGPGVTGAAGRPRYQQLRQPGR